LFGSQFLVLEVSSSLLGEPQQINLLLYFDFLAAADLIASTLFNRGPHRRTKRFVKRVFASCAGFIFCGKDQEIKKGADREANTFFLFNFES